MELITSSRTIKYHNIGTRKQNQITTRGERQATLIPLTHKYTTAHFPGLARTL